MVEGLWRWSEREIIYLSLHCHHQNDFLIKVGSYESHFNVSYCEGQSHKTMSADHNFWRERRAEADSNRGPSAYQPSALPLGQTGSHVILHKWLAFYSAFLNIHPSGVLTALTWLVPHDTASVSACSVYTIQPCHFMQSHIHKVHACLAVYMQLYTDKFIA